MKDRKRIGGAAALGMAMAIGCGVSALSAEAAVITFETAAPGTGFTGPVTENGYKYSLLSGALTVGSPGSSSAVSMQGTIEDSGGGVLDIVGSGGPALFTFAGLDFGAFRSGGTGSQTLTVTGLLGGATVATDTYVVNNEAPLSYTTEFASNLAGKSIDDLRITLNAGLDIGITGSTIAFTEAIDNVVLQPVAAVPEPTGIALLAAGALGLGLTRRRQRGAFGAALSPTGGFR